MKEIYEVIDSPILILNPQHDLISVNRATEMLVGKSQEELLGKKCYEIFHGADQPSEGCPLEKMINSSHFETVEIEIETLGCWFLVSCTPIFDDKGHIKQIIHFANDITERKRAEEMLKASIKEKEVLLKEIHHRVKNNMQVISSLLSLQSRQLKNKKVTKILEECKNRIISISLVHEMLYQSKELNKIDFAEYTYKFISYLFQSHGINPETIKLNIKMNNLSLDINTAIPCGLIINELVSNSLTHAFPEGRNGEICICLSYDKNDIFKLVVSDNGIGFPKDLDFRNTNTLGLQLVVTLVRQLAGSIELDENGKMKFSISFKKPRYEKEGQ